MAGFPARLCSLGWWWWWGGHNRHTLGRASLDPLHVKTFSITAKVAKRCFAGFDLRALESPGLFWEAVIKQNFTASSKFRTLSYDSENNSSKCELPPDRDSWIWALCSVLYRFCWSYHVEWRQFCERYPPKGNCTVACRQNMNFWRSCWIILVWNVERKYYRPLGFDDKQQSCFEII